MTSNARASPSWTSCMSSSSASSRRPAGRARKPDRNTLAILPPAYRASAEERVEFAERLGQGRREGDELVGLARVEPGFCRRGLVREGGQRRHRLADLRPPQRALVAVVVGRIDALGLALDAGHLLDRAAVLGGDTGGDYARERAVVALDAHDPSGGDPQVGGAEV